ncbi:phage tail assembly protein [Vibrio sp. V37_P2S8PM304]|uniref:phage tail assembly protein n=1 Tax=Vibrio sp. V37_P2S8PM304 TaxID=1938688 RepID=UPI0013737514|nr:phage tail assembly protein [Vibrio sp. V37_P2S8PM304]NAX31989.1 phage tail assembly protein [Vibrio sp. V37_P2S8PM304]
MSEVILKTPLKRGDADIKKITFREPDTGTLRGLEMFSILRMDVNTHRQLVPRISDITANEFDMLKPYDLVAVQSEVVSFFTE